MYKLAQSSLAASIGPLHDDDAAPSKTGKNESSKNLFTCFYISATRCSAAHKVLQFSAQFKCVPAMYFFSHIVLSLSVFVSLHQNLEIAVIIFVYVRARINLTEFQKIKDTFGYAKFFQFFFANTAKIILHTHRPSQ